MNYESKLKELGYELKPVDLDTGWFVQAVKTGNLIYTSGQISSWDGKAVKGKVGSDLTVEEGYEAARFCALNCLQAIKTLEGTIDHISRIVKLLGMVNVAPGFDDTPAVINGSSELLREVFGDAGLHARSAVGLTLPFGWAAELEMIVEVN